jgi:hypothetical protein
VLTFHGAHAVEYNVRVALVTQLNVTTLTWQQQQQKQQIQQHW